MTNKRMSPYTLSLTLRSDLHIEEATSAQGTLHQRTSQERWLNESEYEAKLVTVIHTNRSICNVNRQKLIYELVGMKWKMSLLKIFNFLYKGLLALINVIIDLISFRSNVV